MSCELCSSTSNLAAYEVPGLQAQANLCETCRQQLENPSTLDSAHWRALQDNIWSENPAVKVLAWRVLDKLSSESWAVDLSDQLYMEEDLLAAAKAGRFPESAAADADATRDSNGTVLAAGDSVTLIKDLEVKGAGFTAKRGTVVKDIRLTDDTGLIEGRVNGTMIVLKTVFLKKA
jgi:protein PhnA